MGVLNPKATWKKIEVVSQVGVCCAMNVFSPKATWKKIEVVSQVGRGCGMGVFSPVPVHGCALLD